MPASVRPVGGRTFDDLIGAIYCTWVVQDTDVVGPPELWFRIRGDKRGLHIVSQPFVTSKRQQTREDGGQYEGGARPALCTRGGRGARIVRKTDGPVQECGGFSGTSLSRSTNRPSSGSERTFIFRIALLRWTFTVASAIPISPAICLLRRPRAT